MLVLPLSQVHREIAPARALVEKTVAPAPLKAMAIPKVIASQELGLLHVIAGPAHDSDKVSWGFRPVAAFLPVLLRAGRVVRGQRDCVNVHWFTALLLRIGL